VPHAVRAEVGGLLSSGAPTALAKPAPRTVAVLSRDKHDLPADKLMLSMCYPRVRLRRLVSFAVNNVESLSQQLADILRLVSTVRSN